MKLNQLFILFFLIPYIGFAAKKEKPALLVFGSEIEAFTAAMQSAKSGVVTVWVLDEPVLMPSICSQKVSIASNAYMDGGVWLELLMHIAMDPTKRSDSLARIVKKDMNPQLVRNAVDKMLFMQKNLTVLRTSPVERLQRNKNSWDVTLSNKQKYNVRTIIDASATGKLSSMFEPEGQHLLIKPARILKAQEVPLALSRTSMAVGGMGEDTYVYLLQNILANAKDNLFSLQRLIQVDRNAETVPLLAHLGQAVGACAAYTAFFKTTVDKIDCRKVQTELLSFHQRLMPLPDVSIETLHFGAIQNIYLVGLLTGQKHGEGKLLFNARDSVSFAEVKPIFNQLYSRSQLWFANHEGKYFKLADLLSLVKFIGLKGDEIDAQIEKDWSRKLKFEGKYDLQKTINRTEFAVIVNRYAEPYIKGVNMEGQIMR